MKKLSYKQKYELLKCLLAFIVITVSSSTIIFEYLEKIGIINVL